jgi:hypothetical protein
MFALLSIHWYDTPVAAVRTTESPWQIGFGFDGVTGQVPDGEVIVIDCVVLSAQPVELLTTSFTVYVPGSAQACEVDCVPAVAASPKSQSQLKAAPALMGTGVPTQAVAGSENEGDGAVVTLTLYEIVEVQPPSVIVRVAA